MTEDYRVPGTEVYLNRFLAAGQKVTPEQLEALKVSHQLRALIFEAAEGWKQHPTVLRMLAGVFDRLEDEQQKLWNFPVDGRYHHFFELPGCTCPKLDNLERLGTDMMIKANDCPVHGKQA